MALPLLFQLRWMDEDVIDVKARAAEMVAVKLERDEKQLSRVVAGRYRLDAIIGRGGMATVYRGWDSLRDEAVAVKIVSLGARTRAGRSRAFREGTILRNIRDPHAVRLFDIGALEDGSLYLVMELLSGRDLSAVVAEDGTLPVAVAVDYVMQACEALREAHARGVVHRDLKPQNLFLAAGDDGATVVKVIDFGIAKWTRAAGAPTLTQPNTAMGSPRYMAPEQMESADTVDCRADVWSLGIILCELLLGRPPYDGESLVSVFNSIVRDGAPSVSGARDDVPPELDDVIANCLALEPDNRYSSVAELAAALAPFASDSGRLSESRIRTAPSSETEEGLEDTERAGPTDRTASGRGVRRSRRVRFAPALVRGAAAFLLASCAVAAFIYGVRRHGPSGSDASTSVSSQSDAGGAIRQ
jgi:serine/threonine-protein kinase